MSFTAKVKSTGQLFQATNQIRSGGLVEDAPRRIEQNRSYAGHLFDAYPGDSPMVKFSKAAWAIFRSDELEQFDVDYLRLIRVR
jgi:hypothetical protein